MNANAGTSVLRGAAFTISMRWADRLIGLASTLVLARLLVPEDIGIIAMSSLVIGLADMLLDMGVEAALIQNRSATQAHYDSAWTLRLAQMSVSALVVIAATPLATAYFNEPRVGPVLQITALALVLGGLENIGTVTFQKEMRFGRDFQFTFAKRLFGFAVTMAAAWWLRSYWALVMGTLAGRSFGVLLSYGMHPMRPRLSVLRIREIFGFSQWMLLRGIGNYLDSSLHRFLVGRRGGSAVLGGYSLAGDLAVMPSSELLMPLNRVLFPAFVEAQKKKGELKRLFLLAQAVQNSVAIPAAVGLAVTAREVVTVVLGPQWLFSIPFVQILVFATILRALQGSSNFLLITIGHVRTTAMISWAQVILFVAFAVVLLPDADAASIALCRAGSVAAGLLLTFICLFRISFELKVADVLKTFLRPVCASGLMVIAVGRIQAAGIGTPLLLLLLEVVAGAAVYTAAVLLLWRLMGRPDGAESYLLRLLAPFWVRLRTAWSQ